MKDNLKIPFVQADILLIFFSIPFFNGKFLLRDLFPHVLIPWNNPFKASEQVDHNLKM